MSIIAAVCGSNFCTFFSDQRMIRYQQGGEVIDDHFHKILKLNDRVLYGAAGIFPEGEELSAAIAGCPTQNASAKVVAAAIRSYLKVHGKALQTPRSYLVGGKDRSGQFSLTEVQYHLGMKRPEIIQHEPNAAKGEIRLACCLPERLLPGKDKILHGMTEIIDTCRNHRDLVIKISSFLEVTKKLDHTVGGEFETLTIQ